MKIQVMYQLIRQSHLVDSLLVDYYVEDIDTNTPWEIPVLNSNVHYL